MPRPGGVHLSHGLALGAVALVAVCFVLTEQRRGLPAIAATMLLSQPLLHLLAQVGAHADASSGLSVSTTMLLAHLVATAVASWLLADGERLLWALYERLVVALRFVVTAVVADGGPAAVAHPRPRASSRVHVPATPMRGPPLVRS